MAMSSGVADAGGREAAFRHARSGFRYQVSRSGGAWQLEFQKDDGSLHGKKRLAYFVGSGAAARSYVLEDGGFLFEAPVAYYSAAARWDLAPSYDQYAYPYLTRPIVAVCLNCHASSVALAPGTLNRYANPPFGEGGVACERCHGPGEAHIERMQRGRVADGAAIVNPAKLAPDRRDSVCAQCHLAGEVRVMRSGASWNSYHAGDRLADSVGIFVRAGISPGMRVTSHFEKLAQSACKRAAGDRLWCGSCHDPHAVPAAADRAAWFRRKCEGCHASTACRETAANRARRQDDCIACHMPKSTVTDAQHVVYTDHSIPQRLRPETGAPPANADLALFGGGAASPRDLALAYAIAAGRPGGGGWGRALPLLEAAERGARDDVELLVYLAEAYRNTGQADRAVALYRRALALDPAQVTASVSLGGIQFERGDDAGAIPLWRDALSRNSGLVLVATNLAMAQWRQGDPRAAEATLRKVTLLSPGFQPAFDLLKKITGELRSP
jgi:hypothetical protein